MLKQTVSIDCRVQALTRGELAPCPGQSKVDDRQQPPVSSQANMTAGTILGIRFNATPGVLCAACQEATTGAGPVGYRDEEPICDLCLLEESADLGMLIAVACVTRAYASVQDAEPEEHRAALRELGAFGRLFHRFASKSWPARLIKIPGVTGDLLN